MKTIKKIRNRKAGRKARHSKNDLMRLREELIEAHIPLVGEVADEVLCKSKVECKYEELVIVGLTALIEAINNYGPHCGGDFASYCKKTVEKTLVDTFGLRAPTNKQLCHGDGKQWVLGEKIGFGNTSKKEIFTVSEISADFNGSYEACNKMVGAIGSSNKNIEIHKLNFTASDLRGFSREKYQLKIILKVYV